jgi:drug/metabolite transporter (DMT)-like permease
MSWTALLFSATALIAAGTLVEKVLVSKRLPNAEVFLGWFALATLPHALVISYLYPILHGVPLRQVLVMVAAGVSWGIAANLMYRVLRTREVSRVWPIVNINPVYVAIMSSLLLGEVLGSFQWGGIVLAVLGTVLISFQRGGEGGGFKFDRAFFVLAAASFFMAAGQVMQKYALQEVEPPLQQIEPLTGFWLLRVGMFVGLAVNLRGGTIQQIVDSARNPTTLALVVGAEFILFPLAILFILNATAIGSVSVVATVIGTVPVWIFVLSSLLSTRYWNVMNEPLRRDTLVLKSIAIALIVLGIIGISLL